MDNKKVIIAEYVVSRVSDQLSQYHLDLDRLRYEVRQMEKQLNPNDNLACVTSHNIESVVDGISFRIQELEILLNLLRDNK